ncbi:odorant receptor 131-2-like [Pseudophryne corroboree]|uniref:odorant receptor 131-2-like n=1 Tax=Pseudophryne corroboree TaxID=495146 RepID=UPI003081D870
MLNTSGLHSNSSQVSVTNSKNEFINLILALLIIICFFCLFYFMAVMLNVFLTTSSIRETSRYILFLHMLINDTCYIAFATVLLLAANYRLLIPGPTCYLLFIVGSATFKATAYNLATMALERYVAICHPLRHGGLCTTKGTHVAIALMWVVGSIPYVAEIILILSSHNVISFVPIICSQATVIVNPAQNIIRSQSLMIGFTTVGLIILFTYVRIILVAQKISSQSPTALKAGKTVLLHAFQLCLCLASLLSTLTETYPYNYSHFIPTINFLIYSCIPRFLSPLIYGLRDEVLRKYIRQGVLRTFIWRTGHVSK